MVHQKICRRRLKMLSASGVHVRAENEAPLLTLQTPV